MGGCTGHSPSHSESQGLTGVGAGGPPGTGTWVREQHSQDSPRAQCRPERRASPTAQPPWGQRGRGGAIRGRGGEAEGWGGAIRGRGGAIRGRGGAAGAGAATRAGALSLPPGGNCSSGSKPGSLRGHRELHFPWKERPRQAARSGGDAAAAVAGSRTGGCSGTRP